MFNQDDELAKILASVPEFVKKLFRILEMESYKDIIHWSTSGKSFLVKDQAKFSNFVLPRHFKHKNFSTFIRQLNKYDFHKIKNNSENNRHSELVWEFKHQSFQRHNPKLLEKIKRKPIGKARLSRPTFDSTSPSNPVIKDNQTNSLSDIALNCSPDQYSGLNLNNSSDPKGVEYNLTSYNTLEPVDTNASDNLCQAGVQGQLQLLLLQNAKTMQYIQELTAHYNKTISSLTRFLQKSHSNNMAIMEFISTMDTPNQESQKLRDNLFEKVNQTVDISTLSSFPSLTNSFLQAKLNNSGISSTFVKNNISGISPSFSSQVANPQTENTTFSRSPFSLKVQNQFDDGASFGHLKMGTTSQKLVANNHLRMSEPTKPLENSLKSNPIGFSTMKPVNEASNDLNMNQSITIGNLRAVSVDKNDKQNYNNSGTNRTLEDGSNIFLNLDKHNNNNYHSNNNDLSAKTQNPPNNKPVNDLDGANHVYTNSFQQTGFENSDAIGGKNSNRKTLELLRQDFNRQSLINTKLKKECNASQKHFLDNSGSRFAILFKKSKYSQKPSSIIKNINQINIKSNGSNSIGSDNNTIWTKPPKVLLVEDGEVDRDVASRLLKIFGCSIDFAGDGNVAVEKIIDKHYDIVLMDIFMPNLDGVSATNVIRSFDKKTPIISVTSTADTKSCTLYSNTGMTEVLEKPLTKATVFQLLNKYCAHLHTPKPSNLQIIPESQNYGFNSNFQFIDSNKITEIKDSNDEPKDGVNPPTTNGYIVPTSTNDSSIDLMNTMKQTSNFIPNTALTYFPSPNNGNTSENIFKLFENYKYNIPNTNSNSLPEPFNVDERNYSANHNLNSQDNLGYNYFKKTFDQNLSSPSKQNTKVPSFEQQSNFINSDDNTPTHGNVLGVDINEHSSIPKGSTSIENIYPDSNKPKNTNTDFGIPKNQLDQNISDTKGVSDLYDMYKADPHLLSIFNALNSTVSKGSKSAIENSSNDPKINNTQNFHAPIFTFEALPTENAVHGKGLIANSFSNENQQPMTFSNVCSGAGNTGHISLNKHTQSTKLGNSNLYKLKS